MKASDKYLGSLHGKLAKSMSDALEASDVAITLLEEHKDDDIPKPIINFLEKHALANPALLTTVARFLKDNSITCEIEEDEGMSELQILLKEKQQKKASVKKLGTASVQDDVNE